MSVIAKPEPETRGAVSESPAAAPPAALIPEPRGASRTPQPRRGISWPLAGRGKAIAGGLALASGLGVGVGFAATSGGQAGPISSSDVTACSVLTGAQVSSILHAPLATRPGPTTTDQPLAGYDYTRLSSVDTYANSPHAAVFDSCQYQLRSPAVRYVRTSVLPVTEVYLNEILGEAADHRTHDGLRLAPLSGVGDQGVVGDGSVGRSGVAMHIVYARVGTWFVEVDTAGVDQQTTVALAKALGASPRLQIPPAPTA